MALFDNTVANTWGSCVSVSVHRGLGTRRIGSRVRVRVRRSVVRVAAHGQVGAAIADDSELKAPVVALSSKAEATAEDGADLHIGSVCVDETVATRVAHCIILQKGQLVYRRATWPASSLYHFTEGPIGFFPCNLKDANVALTLRVLG